MRVVKTISLSPAMIAYLEEQVKKGGYMSVSEFIRELIRERKDQEILDEIREAEEDIKHGRVYSEKEFKELIK